MAIKTRKKTARKAARKSAKKTKASPVKAPKFLTPRQFRALAEGARRQRISAARAKVAPTAHTGAVVDLSKGFDPAEED